VTHDDSVAILIMAHYFDKFLPVLELWYKIKFQTMGRQRL